MRFFLPDNKEVFYSYFTDDDLVAITDTIRKVEKRMPGEIRIAIRPNAPITIYRNNIEKLAKTEFVTNQMHKSEVKFGIFFYFLLKERKFSILTTEALSDLLPDSTINNLMQYLSKSFSKGIYAESIIYTIKTISDIIISKLPQDYVETIKKAELKKEIERELKNRYENQVREE